MKNNSTSNKPSMKPFLIRESCSQRVRSKPLLGRFSLQARQVRKASTAVEQQVANLTRNVQVLQGEDCLARIPCFRRKDIDTGDLLGSGSFSQVFEVTRIEGGQSSDNSTVSSPCSESLETSSTVWASESSRHERAVNGKLAIKQLKQKLLRRPKEFRKAAADLLVEAKFLAILDHPNIIKLRGISRGGATSLSTGKYDSVFLLMDRLTATLDDRIEEWKGECNGNPSVTLKSFYALQVAKALRYLHSRRIIFRDVKPANVGFTSNDGVKLFDFGLCRELPVRRRYDVDEFFHMTKTGTKRYMAVEIYLSGKYNLKADSYSWALTFFEMLSLVKPYHGMNWEEIIEYACLGANRPDLSLIADNMPSSLVKLIHHSWAQFVMDRVTMDYICPTLEKILEEELGDGALWKDALDAQSFSAASMFTEASSEISSQF